MPDAPKGDEWWLPAKEGEEAFGDPISYGWNELKKLANPAAQAMQRTPTWEAMQDPAARAARLTGQVPIAAQQGNLDALMKLSRASEKRDNIAFDPTQANQSRAGMMDAYNMMLASSRQPGVAAMQGNIAQGQGLAAALQQQVGQPGAAGQARAAQTFGGIAGDTGGLAAKEAMAQQKGLVSGASTMRQGDIDQAEATAKTNIASQAMTDKLVARLLSEGYSLGEAMRAGRAAQKAIENQVYMDQVKKILDPAGSGAAIAVEAARGEVAGGRRGGG